MSTAVYEPGCQISENLAICGVGGFQYRRLLHCPTCKRRRRFVVRWQMWYGDDTTCTACGDTWQEGFEWLCTRPFERGWRTKAIVRAKGRYAEAVPYPVFVRAQRAYLRDYFAETDKS